MEEKNSLAVFQDKKIRRIWHNDEWYFSVIDVVEALTGSVDAKDYWYKLKKREAESSKIELSTFCRQLKILAQDGKLRETDCANTEGLFRIIQSIPSPKAEPFKLWLAKEGGEVAGNAREDLEKRSGKKVVTSENYLAQPEKAKRLERKKN